MKIAQPNAFDVKSSLIHSLSSINIKTVQYLFHTHTHTREYCITTIPIISSPDFQSFTGCFILLMDTTLFDKLATLSHLNIVPH
jgi:hypothetical protein